jgi:hypothetical protein
MSQRPEIWLVARDEQLVAELVVERLDGPWVRGRVDPRDGFAALRPVFEHEQRLAGRLMHDPFGWWRAQRSVRRAIRLIKPNGEEASEFLLHIDGRRASWRYWEFPALRPPAVLILVLAALITLAAAPTALARRPIRHRTSNNWAGYAVTAASGLKAVSGFWSEPRIACDQPFPTYSALWVGLGGLKRRSSAIEQIGAEADCTAGGRPKTFAWYELFPAAPVKLALAVREGDQLAATVFVRGGSVTLRLRNLTTGNGFTRTVAMSAPDTTSADWIAEAPSGCDRNGNCEVLPLTDFGTVTFDSATATPERGRAGTILDPAFSTTKLTLAAGEPPLGPPPPGAPPGANMTLGTSGRAVASALSQHGTSFNVTVER